MEHSAIGPGPGDSQEPTHLWPKDLKCILFKYAYSPLGHLIRYQWHDSPRPSKGFCAFRKEGTRKYISDFDSLKKSQRILFDKKENLECLTQDYTSKIKGTLPLPEIHLVMSPRKKKVGGGFLRGSGGKESTCSAGDLGSIPGSGRSPGEGNGYPLKYSCLENPMDRGTWWAVVHGVTKTVRHHWETEGVFKQ